MYVSLKKICYITAIFPSSFTSLIRPSHTKIWRYGWKSCISFPSQSFPVCPIFLATFKSCDLHICVCACLHAVHSTVLTSLTQLLMSVLWWAFGKVSSSSSWTLSVSQQPLSISVTRMSATPPEPARISHGVELPMPLYILCREGQNVQACRQTFKRLHFQLITENYTDQSTQCYSYPIISIMVLFIQINWWLWQDFLSEWFVLWKTERTRLPVWLWPATLGDLIWSLTLKPAFIMHIHMTQQTIHLSTEPYAFTSLKFLRN